MSVYFVQPSGGGHIKVGCSGKPDLRHKQIARLFPYGIDVLAIIDGNKVTEGFIHQCFRPLATATEWFRADPAIWRFILEILDHGAPSYLPDLTDRRDLRTIADEEFGGLEEAKAALGYAAGYSNQDIFTDVNFGGGGCRARMAFARAWRRGLLPSYITALHSGGLKPGAINDNYLRLKIAGTIS